MTEVEELELLNGELNAKLAARLVKNLIQCPECKGKGELITRKIIDLWKQLYKEVREKCTRCNRTGYIENC